MKHIGAVVGVLAIFLALTECIPAPSAGSSICSGGGQYHSNPSDCSSFYQCSNGKAVLQPCPSGLHWNSKINVCDWPANAGCTGGDDSDDSDSGDSSKSSGDASTSEESVPGSKSSSSESVEEDPEPKPKSESEPSSESGDSSKSSGDSSTSEESVPGSDSSSSSDSSECPADKNKPKCPASDPKYSVFFAHSDPHWFYHCSNGVAYCKQCPSNLVWNTNCDTCDWEGQNNCPSSESGDSSKSSGDSSTSEESVPGSKSSSSESVEEEPKPEPAPEPSSESGDSSKSSGDSSTSEESVPGSDSSSSSDSSECPADKNKPKCPAKDPKYSVFFAHSDPHWFYHCSNGVAYCKQCPSNLVWNTNCDTCDWEGQNNCPSSESGDSSKSSGDSSTSEESVPGSKSSSSESVEEKPKPKPKPEPSSESGDSSKSSGDSSTSEESVPGSDSSSSSDSSECPADKKKPKCPASDPKNSVFFAHSDPHWFYHCSNGVAYCKQCPSNLVWNTNCDTCDWEGQNNCPSSESGDSSKSSGDSSTSEESVPGSDSSSEE